MRLTPRHGAAVAALAAAAFAVHAVPAGPPRVTPGAVALADGHRLAFALPARFTAVPGRPDAWHVVDGDGLRRCRAVLTLTAEASARGIRFEPSRRRLAYRLGGRRRVLVVAAARERGERRAFRGDLRRVRVGRRPVEAVLRFPAPAKRALPPAVLVRTAVEAVADTSSPVQRTPAYLARCAGLARTTVPAALDALEASASVTRTPR